MALPGLWNRLTSAIFGVGVGGAIASEIEPVFEAVKQDAWRQRAIRVLDPEVAAEIEAKAIPLEGVDLLDDSRRSGVGQHRFDLLVQLQRAYPGLAEIDHLSNRGIANPQDVRGWLNRHGYSDEVAAQLAQLFQDLLSVADTAAAVQQGHLANDGILPEIDPTIPFPSGYEQPPAPDDAVPSSVPLTEITSIKPIKEAAGQGVDLDRLRVIANLSGLPPGPAELLTMWNRNLIDQAAVDAGLREGHLKTKWTHAFKRMRWAVLSAPEYANLWLRGWITKDDAIKGAALTGHTPEQTELLYKNRGRPLAPVQAYTAWAREAPHPVGEGLPDRPGTFDFADFKQAIQRSDIRTEYVEPLWHNRWAYPSLFQLGRLASAGALSEDRVRVILKYERYEQQDIDALVRFWYDGKGPTADPHVTKAQVQLWGTTHRTFVAAESNEGDARARFDLLGIPGDAQGTILELWASERELIRKQLTPAQIKKAWSKMSKNYATGAPWTRDDAIAALVSQGYSAIDANDYLDIPSGR